MSQWNDLTSIFFFLQYIYAVNRNKFSPFWVHEQRERINIILREYNRTTLSAKF